MFKGFDEDDPAKTPEIRVSVGWRNPQEDGYDVTSMSIGFTTDGKVKAACVDGYSNGSISTKYYNPNQQVPFLTQKWNEMDIYNITIKEWTDIVNIVDYNAPGSSNFKLM